MTEVIFLGVGGALATGPADDHTALVVCHENSTVLLDAGPTIVRQLERCHLSAGDLTHAFISHQHGDHALGFPMLLLQRVIFWPDRPLAVLGTPLVLDTLQALARLSYPDLMERAEPIIDFVALEQSRPGRPLPGAPSIRCSVRPGRHSVPTWGVRLALGESRSLVYSSDTAPTSSLADLAAGADLLVHEAFYVEPSGENEASHSAAVEVGRLAAQAGARRLALVHRMDTSPAQADAYRAAAARFFEGPILVPQGGDRVVL